MQKSALKIATGTRGSIQLIVPSNIGVMKVSFKGNVLSGLRIQIKLSWVWINDFHVFRLMIDLNTLIWFIITFQYAIPWCMHTK